MFEEQIYIKIDTSEKRSHTKTIDDNQKYRRYDYFSNALINIVLNL